MKNFFTTYKEVVGILIAFAILLSPMIVTAAGTTVINGSTHVSAPSSGANSFSIENPLRFKTICGLIKGLLDAVMIIGIPIAVLFVVWAGFKFIWAQGNSGELTKARANLLAVIIGIAIFLGASLIAQVILNTIQALGVTGINSCS